jgi:uncharacterized protein YdeI (YjbR/CyaY-like superfamily)
MSRENGCRLRPAPAPYAAKRARRIEKFVAVLARGEKIY